LVLGLCPKGDCCDNEQEFKEENLILTFKFIQGTCTNHIVSKKLFHQIHWLFGLCSKGDCCDNEQEFEEENLILTFEEGVQG
jgi:hypothetical protein